MTVDYSHPQLKTGHIHCLKATQLSKRRRQYGTVGHTVSDIWDERHAAASVGLFTESQPMH